MTDYPNDTAANDTDAGRLHGATSAVRDAAANAKAVAGDALASAREKVGDTVDAVKEKSGAAYSVAVDRTSDAYDVAREKAGEAYTTARQKASEARQATVEGIDENPFAALVGGIALGVLVGALLPRSRREAAALAPVAGRLAEMAKSAAIAARDAGRQKLDELGVNSEAARGKVEKLVDTAVETATSAGNAAANAVRK